MAKTLLESRRELLLPKHKVLCLGNISLPYVFRFGHFIINLVGEHMFHLAVLQEVFLLIFEPTAPFVLQRIVHIIFLIYVGCIHIDFPGLPQFLPFPRTYLSRCLDPLEVTNMFIQLVVIFL